MRPTLSRTELTPIVSYNPRDLALIRRTVASDTTDDEFALFIHWARSLRLDPLRRQVHAFVFHKHDPKKRRLSLAPRSKVSAPSPPAPDETEPSFIADDALKSETNPAGLVSCSVRVWQYAHGQWFPITGVARWEEFAPLKTVWVDNQPTDRKILDKTGRWGDMPFLMLARCAEAGAHPASRPSRRGRRDARTPRTDRRPRCAHHRLARRCAPRRGAPRQAGRRIVAFLRERRGDTLTLTTWRERNRHALREFWARAHADALGVKQELEKATGAKRQADDITPSEKHGDSMTATAQRATPHVGIFWVVQTPNGEVKLLTASCPLDQAEPYGDCLTYGPGHYETWAHWRRDRTVDPALRALVRSYEYEDWPRGRIVFDRSRDLFVLYADRKLLTPATIARIETQFHLPEERTESQSDFHYQSTETTIVLD
jgi:hypothetical protein